MQSEVSLIADPGVISLILALPHISMEIDPEIFSVFILLLPLIQEGPLLATSESMWIEYWITPSPKFTQEKVWLG